MMAGYHKRYRVGELRPSQVLFTYGVGAIIDLPHISTLVMGLDDWEVIHSVEIGEVRLLQAVQTILGPQVKRLLTPPAMQELPDGPFSPLDESASVGIPVAPFPRSRARPRTIRPDGRHPRASRLIGRRVGVSVRQPVWRSEPCVIWPLTTV